MKKIKEYHICDRCKKEINEEEINLRYDYAGCYELCDDCDYTYIEFNTKVQNLKEKWEELEKKYKFGKYLPKERVD